MPKARQPSQLSLDKSEPEAQGAEPAAASVKEASFEEGLDRLNTIVDELEGGELSLEDSLRLFEEGVALAKKAQAKLDAAEKRVEELLGFDEDGNPETNLIEPE